MYVSIDPNISLRFVCHPKNSGEACCEAFDLRLNRTRINMKVT